MSEAVIKTPELATSLNEYKNSFIGLLNLMSVSGIEVDLEPLVEEHERKITGDTIPLSLYAARAVLHDLEKKESRQDHLTGLGNRRAMEEFWGSLKGAPGSPEVSRRLTEQSTHYLVSVVDLSMFKMINDVFGHPTGDKLLTTVADVLRCSLKREKDGLFRVGGDEFVIILECADGNSDKRAQVNEWLLSLLSEDGDNSAIKEVRERMLADNDGAEINLGQDVINSISPELQTRYAGRFDEREFAKRVLPGRQDFNETLEFVLGFVGFAVGSDPTVGDPGVNSLNELIERADRRTYGSKRPIDSGAIDLRDANQLQLFQQPQTPHHSSSQ